MTIEKSFDPSVFIRRALALLTENMGIGDVSPQATVVVRGGERLRDGQTVKWEEPLPVTEDMVSEAL